MSSSTIKGHRAEIWHLGIKLYKTSLNLKRKCSHGNMDKCWGHDAQGNKPNTKGQMLCGSTHRGSLEEPDPETENRG